MSNRIKYIRTSTLEKTPIGEDTTGLAALCPSNYRKQDEIAATALSYFDNRFDTNNNPRFVYGWHHTYRDEAFLLGKIDCSALVGLVIRGVSYIDSPYGQAYAATTNNRAAQFGDWVGIDKNGTYSTKAPTSYDSDGNPVWNRSVDPSFDPDTVICNKNMSWAVNPRDYWCLGNYKTVDSEGDSDAEDSTEEDDGVFSQIPAQVRPLSAANIAQLLLSIGDVVPINDGFSRIEKGDILFWAVKDNNGDYKRPTRFLCISHTAVVVEIDENGNHLYVDSMSSKPPNFILDNTIRKACLETDLPSADYLVLVIRLPQGRAWERLRIIYNPEDKKIAEGDTQRFTCIASGDIVHYQWQYSSNNGTTWVNSTLPKTGSIPITPSAGMNGRLYHCVCTDTHGRSLTSRDALLTVTAPLTITTQPVDTTVALNATAQFSVVATGIGLSYQWQYSANNGATWNNSTVSSGTTSTLSFKASSSYNGRMYRCIITDVNEDQVISDAATLTIS